jgi:cobalt-zinc-cadmium efflux system membrane fusion protein
MTNFKKNLLITALLLAVIGVQSCSKAKASEGEEKKETAFCVSDTLAKMIKIEPVALQNIQAELQLNGEVSFNEDKVSRVMSPVGGQVLSIKANLGDYVKKGQVLATIKSMEVVSNYNEIATSRADVEMARKNMETAESLWKTGINSERDYQQAREEYNKAVSNSQKAKEVVDVYSSANAKGEITLHAPSSGYILDKKIVEGMVIRNDDADALFTIGDMNEVWVLANIYEQDLAKVQEGYAVKIKTLAYPDKTFEGRIEKINTVLDPLSKTAKARIRLTNNAASPLRPQMFATITVFNTEKQQAITVPSSSVIFEFGKNYVIVYKDKCNVESREVEIMQASAYNTYLSGGVKAGEKVVSQGQLFIYTGLKER